MLGTIALADWLDLPVAGETGSEVLVFGEASVGALNLYAASERAFGDKDTEIGRLFAAQATIVVANAEAYWGARLQSEHLERALAGREVIDLAKGIIMAPTGWRPGTRHSTRW